MITHKITKGFDLRIKGAPAREFADAPEPAVVAVRPSDFPGIKPKLRVQEGDTVRTGDPLFYDKNRPDCVFVAPASGVVSRVALGPRRLLLAVEVAVDKNEQFASIPQVSASSSRDEIVAALLGAGLWPLVRQRPVGKIADPAARPVAVFINGMDSAPLAADPAFALEGRGEDLQAGVDLLRRLTDGSVYLSVRPGGSPVFTGLKGVELHAFDGPHPAGLVGTHIHTIRPLKMGETVYALRAEDVARIGSWARTGRYPAKRVVAVAGEQAMARRYVRVRDGARLDALLGKTHGAEDRVICGTVLDGKAAPGDGCLGFYATSVTVIAEGAHDRELFGWGLPQPKRLSMFRAVWPFPGKSEVSVDARMNGGHRPPVNIGAYAAVTPLGILPSFLMRAIQANDLDEALQLGLLEVTEEDVALCTVVDPCKNDVGAVIRKGLDLYERES
ncbi:MAG: Na(+)-translocating NADH-quinone reductase subunit A [Planctomycetota bacterium]